jgi:hypothetical protein
MARKALKMVEIRHFRFGKNGQSPAKSQLNIPVLLCSTGPHLPRGETAGCRAHEITSEVAGAGGIGKVKGQPA